MLPDESLFVKMKLKGFSSRKNYIYRRVPALLAPLYTALTHTRPSAGLCIIYVVILTNRMYHKINVGHELAASNLMPESACIIKIVIRESTLCPKFRIYTCCPSCLILVWWLSALNHPWQRLAVYLTGDHYTLYQEYIITREYRTTILQAE